MRFNLCFWVPREYEESRGLEDQTRSKLKKPEGGWKEEEGGRGEAFWVIAIVKPRRSVTTTNPPTQNENCSAKQILTLYHSTMGVGVPRMGQSNLTVSPNRNVCFDVTDPEMWGGPEIDTRKKEEKIMYYISVEIKRKDKQEKQFQLGNDDNAQYGALLLLTAESGTVGGPWPSWWHGIDHEKWGGMKMVKSASFTEKRPVERSRKKKKKKSCMSSADATHSALWWSAFHIDTVIC